MNRFSEMDNEIKRLSEICIENGAIDPELYGKYDVKRGLRDINGKGVLAGLTEISEVCSSAVIDGVSVPCDGKLYYRGIDIEDIVKGFVTEKRFGFEETVYLLLFGKLPKKEELSDFCALLAKYRTLPTSFVRDIILKAPSADMMNALARSVLTLFAYDDNASDTSIPNVLRQCLEQAYRLTSRFFKSEIFYIRIVGIFFLLVFGRLFVIFIRFLRFFIIG